MKYYHKLERMNEQELIQNLYDEINKQSTTENKRVLDLTDKELEPLKEQIKNGMYLPTRLSDKPKYPRDVIERIKKEAKRG
jgi:ribosomal protein S13